MRLEERKAREDAEGRLDRALEALRQQADLLRDIEREVIRGQTHAGD